MFRSMGRSTVISWPALQGSTRTLGEFSMALFAESFLRDGDVAMSVLAFGSLRASSIVYSCLRCRLREKNSKPSQQGASQGVKLMEIMVEYEHCASLCIPAVSSLWVLNVAKM